MTRKLHLASGLVLFAYLLVHLVNHALLVVSIGAADATLAAIHPWLVWAPVTGVLLAALGTHVTLALVALWRRRTLRFTAYEALQYALGFAMPLALVPHVAHTRIADSLYGQNWGYYRNMLSVYWELDPVQALSQGALLLAAWTHAMLGLNAWLRLKPWFPAARRALGVAALLLPTLAFAGFVAGGNEARLRLATDPAFRARLVADQPPPEIRAALGRNADMVRFALLAALAGVLGARLVRDALRRRESRVRISYPDGRGIAVPRGFSVLEASWLLGVPHASVCGGRGRCSTCRVRVAAADPAALPPPDAEEARVLARIKATPDMRLACQLRPRGPVGVAPLLDAAQPPHGLLRFREPLLLGEERVVAILFADISGFTRIAEHRLPFDVVHLLNRYFRAMGEAVESAGGRVDKFLGDGVMALFGAEEGREEAAADPAAACRAGLEGARRMSLALATLNRSVGPEIGEPLRIGIGLHVGPVILGAMGHGRTVGLTAIGDAVNTASRLEAATKALGCELVVSQAVLEAAGVALPDASAAPHEVQVRGRHDPLKVRAVPRADALPARG